MRCRMGAPACAWPTLAWCGLRGERRVQESARTCREQHGLEARAAAGDGALRTCMHACMGIETKAAHCRNSRITCPCTPCPWMGVYASCSTLMGVCKHSAAHSHVCVCILQYTHVCMSPLPLISTPPVGTRRASRSSSYMAALTCTQPCAQLVSCGQGAAWGACSESMRLDMLLQAQHHSMSMQYEQYEQDKQYALRWP